MSSFDQDDFLQYVHAQREREKKERDKRDCLTSTGPIDKTLTNTIHARNILSIITIERISFVIVMQLNKDDHSLFC